MKKLFIIFLILLFTSNCVLADAKNYKVFTPAQYSDNDNLQSNNYNAIMLLVDFSSSMVRQLSTVKAVINEILPKVSRSTPIGLRVFGEFISKTQSRASMCKATERISLPRYNNHSDIKNQIESMQVGFLTPLTFALKETINKDFVRYPKYDKKKIILITDGIDTCGQNICMFIKTFTKSRSDIVIDVIATGSSAAELRCLSDETNGNFYYLNNINKFKEIFTESLGTTKQQNNDIHYKFIPLK